VEKKISTQNETLVQLEILDAELDDSGVYELVARTEQVNCHNLKKIDN
jgi:hypothetical protein